MGVFLHGNQRCTEAATDCGASAPLQHCGLMPYSRVIKEVIVVESMEWWHCSYLEQLPQDKTRAVDYLEHFTTPEKVSAPAQTENQMSTSWLADRKMMACSTDRFRATGVQLTGDELRFQHFSAPTHPTGYMWEGKSRSSVKTEPWEMSKWYRWGSWSNYSSITQNDIWKNFRSETVFHCATRKLVKQSYLQVVFWCLFGFSNPINNVRSPQQSQTHSSNRPTSRQLDWFTIFREHCWKCGSEFCQVIKIKKKRKGWKRSELPVVHEL